jgi:hypothetical protein
MTGSNGSGGGSRIFNKGHLVTSVFNNCGTLVGEMV